MSDKKIERADQLPPHVYSLPDSVSTLLTDGDAFERLTCSVVRDLETDLEEYEIADKATLRNYYRARSMRTRMVLFSSLFSLR